MNDPRLGALFSGLEYNARLAQWERWRDGRLEWVVTDLERAYGKPGRAVETPDWPPAWVGW